jgi:hypothetical protein
MLVPCSASASSPASVACRSARSGITTRSDCCGPRAWTRIRGTAAQLEHEIDQHKNQLLGVEARLRSIAREDSMPADDVVARTIPATGVVVIAGQAPGFGAANVVPVVNELVAQFDQLRIQDRVKQAGPRIIFYEPGQGEDITVVLALPVTEPPAALPAPASYRVLPEIEAAVAVRSGPAAGIFPMVYQDLVRWITERGYHPVPASGPGPGREVWVHDKDDSTEPGPQVFEIQLPFTRPDGPVRQGTG